MSASLADASLFRRLAPLFAAMFCGFLVITVPLPVLPLHVHSTLGYGTAIAGLTVGLQSFATILTRPWAGRMVDRDGAKATLMRGLATSSGAGLTYLASVIVSPSPAASLAVLLAGRLVLGIGESLLITGVLNWAVLRAGPGRSGRAMAWNGMAQYLALAVGAPLGFAIDQVGGFRLVACAAVVLPALALLVVIPLEPAPALGGTRLPLRSVIGQVWRPGLALTLAGVGFASVSTFASLDFAAKGWSGAGLALSAFGLGFVAVRLVASGLPDRYGGHTVAALSMGVEAIGQVLLWLAPSPLVADLGAGLTGAGCSLNYPALGVEAVRGVTPSSRGVALAAFSAFQDLAIGATGPLLGLVAAAAGPPAVFAIGGLTAVAGIAASLAMPRRNRVLPV